MVMTTQEGGKQPAPNERNGDIWPLLDALSQRGIQVSCESGNLRVRGPKGSIRPDELHRLRAQKTEILRELADVADINRIPVRPRVPGCQVPLSVMQQFWWRGFLQRFGLTRKSRRVCTEAMRILGPIDVGLLKECIKLSVERHESLRTTIRTINGIPTQNISIRPKYDFELVDSSRHTGPRSEQDALSRVEEFLDETVDLCAGPLMAVRLFKISAERYILVAALEHIVADGVSTQILKGEIWKSYGSRLRGAASQLPSLPVQFGDLAMWQHEIHHIWTRRHVPYWTEHLAGAPYLSIPVDQGLVEAEKPVGLVLSKKLGGTLSAGVLAQARRSQTLPSLLVLAAHVVIVSRWSKQRDTIVALLSNGRDRPELAGMIGYLSYYLHLRIRIEAKDRFRNLLDRVKEEYHLASEHRDFGWAPLCVPGCRETYLNVDHVFNWLPDYWSDDPCADIEGRMSVKPFPVPSKVACKFRLSFCEGSEGIEAIVQYRPDQLRSSTVESYLRSLCKVLKVLVHNPDIELTSLPVCLC